MQIEVEQTEAHAEVVEMMPMDIEAVGHALSSDAEDIKPGTINSFTFRDLGYTVVTPEGPRVVLQHVSGHLATKEMLAMMVRKLWCSDTTMTKAGDSLRMYCRAPPAAARQAC
jgi:hypothetical protein